MNRNLTKNNIILFHSEGEDVLLRTGVLSDLEYHIYNPLVDVKYSLTNMFYALKYCLKYKPKLIKRNFLSLDYLRILAREFRAQVMVDNLRRLSPKVVLTWLDNSDLFHRACKSCNEIPFLAIANSARTTWCASDALPDAESKYYIDEFFCYGPRMKLMFEKYGHKIKKYTVCGSLPGGFYFSKEQNIQSNEKKKYDVCIVSQWHKAAWDKSVDSIFDTGYALDTVSSYVSRYSNENDIKVCVALRSHNPEEKEYFKKYFQGKCYFEECDREIFSSYRAITSSNLVIAINSSLSVEAFGAGLKVLFVNPTGQERIRQTDSMGVWYLSKPAYGVFSERVKLLLDMSIDAYHLEADHEIKNVMSYDFSKLAHVICRERLLDLISS